MSTRMQQRRGTASQWISTNSGNGPILAAGEIGFESDTNKFKIGDGINHWVDLVYFTDAAGATAAINDLIANAPSSLDTLGEIAAAINNDPSFLTNLATQTYVDTAVGNATVDQSTLAGVGIDWNVGTEQFDIDSTVATKTYADNAASTAAGLITKTSIGLGNVTNTSDANKPVSTATQTALNLKADLASPTFTGTPLAPTASSGTNTTQIATTAFVSSAISNLIGGAPDALNTLNELATALNNDSSYASTITSALSAKAPLANPSFTGTVDVSGAQITGVATPTNNSDAANKGYVLTLAQNSLTDFSALTTNIHGITNTADLVLTNDDRLSDNRTPIDDSVSTNKIKDGAVTNAKLAATSVHEGNIQNLAVTTGKIDDLAVTTAKIANNNITEAKINDGAVTTDKIGSLAVTEGKIADGSVTSAKIANGTIVNADISTVAAIDQSKVNGLTTDLAAKASASDLSTHESATTSVHGIADTAALATKTYADTAASTAESNAKTYADSLTTKEVAEDQDYLYFTDERAQDAIGNHLGTGLSYDDNTGAISVNTTTIQARVSNVSDTEIGYLDGVTSSIQTQINAKAPIADPTFTGTTTVNHLAISGDLVFTGTATQIDQTNLTIEDSLIYLADAQFDSDILDIGMYGAYGDSGAGHWHTGLIRDASDGIWKLISGGSEPTTNVVDFTGVTYDTLKLGALQATSATIGNVSNTELQYLDGVTSAIQTQLDSKLSSSTASSTYETISNVNLKAPKADPTFTGTVTVASAGIAFTDKTQTKAGVPSLTVIGSTVSSGTTLDALGAEADVRDSLIPLSGAVNISFEATGNAKYAVGSSIGFYQASGTGANITGNGITILATPGGTLRTTASSVTATKVGSTTWLLAGDLKA